MLTKTKRLREVKTQSQNVRKVKMREESKFKKSVNVKKTYLHGKLKIAKKVIRGK